jgi:hypothetical protein
LDEREVVVEAIHTGVVSRVKANKEVFIMRLFW